MVTLLTAVSKTPKNIHKNSQSCRPKIKSATMNADGFGVFKLLKGMCIDPTTTKTPYPQVVKVYTDKKGKVANNPRVFCWCGCDWFKYNCEVALAIRGSSAIISSNGNLPKITNPRGRPQVCKHLLAYLKAVVRNKEKLDTVGKKPEKKSAQDARLEKGLATKEDQQAADALTGKKAKAQPAKKTALPSAAKSVEPQKAGRVPGGPPKSAATPAKSAGVGPGGKAPLAPRGGKK